MPREGRFCWKNMRKLLKKVYVFGAIAASFIATVAPAVIRAADIVPPSPSDTTGTVLLRSMRVTAYSSSPDETDDTPFITAAGTKVRDGIVATNAFPLGTKIQIPALFGSQIFTVEDRMNRRMKNVVDVWMPTKSAAITFGVSYANVVLVKDKVLSYK